MSITEYDLILGRQNVYYSAISYSNELNAGSL
jgi:hypothetical protein